ncbi:MAG: MBOAT family protein [Deltaproteobacteria bacterium]|nr:MBOAT family protein [Deltaproteobacteria bacterium]
MLFSSPDYPLFLLAVFFLYALARWGGPRMWPARIVLMVLLGDLIVLLVAKDPDALWDPFGGALFRYAASDHPQYQGWPTELFVRWGIGAAVLVAAIVLGRRGGPWMASARGQQLIGRGFVAALAAVGAGVYVAHANGTLDEATAVVVAHAHLVVLVILGVGIGATTREDTRPLGRVVILFVASSLFYHAWAAAMPGPYRYLLALLLATIVLDYYLGIWIEETEDPYRRKALVIVSLCSNLGILAFFKYADFFTQDIANPVLGTEIRPLHLILPAGISFHTFQSLSYTIDVYRRELKATRSVIKFATFVLFFPQLVAGPIVRAQDLLPQLEQLPPMELQAATRGLFRICTGLFKKIAIADTLALAIVDRVFEAPERFSSLEVAVGVWAYALQIFCDFSAYSDIAIGSAQVLGITLPENFRTPYRSANLQEFWRRWHISLSTWLRDYLYITLGGSKGAPWRTYVNLITTMLLGGLWHGASFAFIVWGALHGFGLAVTRFFQRRTAGGNIREAWSLLGGCALLAVLGLAAVSFALTDVGTWTQLVVIWLVVTPLWAVLTAWAGAERPPEPGHSASLPFLAVWGRDTSLWVPEVLRIAMCGSAVGFFYSLYVGDQSVWIPLIGLTWVLGLVADIVERGSGNLMHRTLCVMRRAVAVICVFQYVCLAWIFFRASSFENALAILRRLAAFELDAANVVPLVTVTMTAGFAIHFFAEGSYRWLRDRFVELPAPAKGFVLACVALVLRELAHTKMVPFIYFQF